MQIVEHDARWLSGCLWARELRVGASETPEAVEDTRLSVNRVGQLALVALTPVAARQIFMPDINDAADPVQRARAEALVNVA